MKYGMEIPIDIQILNAENRRYVTDFACGNPAIDHYFSELAAEDPAAVTYLFLDTAQKKVMAYMTIACSGIFYFDEDNVTPEAKMSTIISAMEIVFFAVDDAYKHIPFSPDSEFTLSQFLFSYMIDRMRNISETIIGAKAVVLYSVPEAVHFYQRCSFREFGEAMYGDKGFFVEGCIPMYYYLND